ncbi:MAG: hypothetical protein JETT_0136 [Candidatus Jettenia ecosi]|uniref:Uncharacterized protein n=1 Tax=Candidatus Jettenia ecosi TaxID=2494326 RepID=A0A533QFE8_9BACT|nr:MAG: hypothetical protein JETT_0136 [Candidatus Jettenia ecosi]
MTSVVLPVKIDIPVEFIITENSARARMEHRLCHPQRINQEAGSLI